MAATLSRYRHGTGDLTTALDGRTFVHATWTPDGPATLVVRWTSDLTSHGARGGVSLDAFGPGADAIAARATDIAGWVDQPVLFPTAPAIVNRALKAAFTSRFGATRNLYHQLLPTILAQRITAGEAIGQWHRLCAALGSPAPGPGGSMVGVRLPPDPEVLAAQPSWWFHRLGVERKRAETLIEVARHFDRLWEWSLLSSQVAQPLLRKLRGVGEWTATSVAGTVFGDPDSPIVGDFHMPNAVAWHLVGQARADDVVMLELLQPFAGHRGRVQAALVRLGSAPAFGPRRRGIPVARL